MPPFVFLLLRHAAIGFGLALAFMAMLLALDVANLRTIMLASSSGPLALCVLTFVLGLTFASVQMGIAIMGLGDDDDDDDRGGRRRKPVPVPVRVPRRPGSFDA